HSFPTRRSSDLGDENLAHACDSGQARRCLRYLWRADFLGDFFPVEENAILYTGFFLLRRGRLQFDVRFVCELFQLRFVIERNLALQSVQRQGAVHRAAIEIEIAENARHEAGYATLAGTGGAVDRDGEFWHGKSWQSIVSNQ